MKLAQVSLIAALTFLYFAIVSALLAERSAAEMLVSLALGAVLLGLTSAAFELRFLRK